MSFFLAGMLMVSIDSPISAFFARPEMEGVWLFARRITNIGLSEYYFAFAAVCYVFFKWIAPQSTFWRERESRRKFLQHWALNFLAALIGSGVAIHIIKFTVGRQRPHKSAPFYDPLVFEPLNWHWHWHSFPSGHSQVMFTVATMMSIAWPRLTWLWVLFAACICFTRVIVHDHFLSDTVFGAAVGYSATLVVLYYMKKKTARGLV